MKRTWLPPPAAERGFLLPLATTGAMLLILSSLSLQGMALQQRAQVAAQQRLRQLEDRLMSAAQTVAGRLQRRHRCLLALDQNAWTLAPCVGTGELPGLLAGESEGGPYRLVGYCAGSGRGELLLELGGTTPGRRGAFALDWVSGTTAEPQLRGLRELGLRSATAPSPVCGEVQP
ncbi:MULTISPECIES: hypothetical protein [Aphanothece]|uniref:hypothetical protein n=1 Tax=Aphanothece TaxID=1121 RepID=UPI0039850263